MAAAGFGLLFRVVDSLVTMLAVIASFQAWGVAPALVVGVTLTAGFHYVGQRFGLNA